VPVVEFAVTRQGRDLLVLGGGDIRRLMPMRDCIEIVDAVMRTVSRGGAVVPVRLGFRLPGSGNILGAMPGYVAEPACLGAKLVAVYPENARRGLSSHVGVVVMFEPDTGVPIGILDAHAITGLRTAAASAVATRALARADSRRLAILGTGEQAEAHAHAMAAVLPLESIVIWGRTPEKAATLAAHVAAALGIAATIAATAEQAVADADVICTTTASPEPILLGVWVRRGTHVNLVGACTAATRETDAGLVAKSAFFVDLRASAMAEAGELLEAMGPLAEGHIRGEIGELLDGRVLGRGSEEQITVYKSLGIAAQDLAVGHALLERARAADAGTRVPF
jgi:ornithine cyclodeaminase